MPRYAAGPLVLLGDFRLAVGGRRLRRSRHVDGQAADDRHHPGKRGQPGGIIVDSVAPDLQISLLQDLGSEVRAAQNPQHYAVELGAGRPVEALEGDRIAFGDRRKQPGDFHRRRHETRSSSSLAATSRLVRRRRLGEHRWRTAPPANNAFAPTCQRGSAASGTPKGDYGRRSPPPSRMNFPRAARRMLEFRTEPFAWRYFAVDARPEGDYARAPVRIRSMAPGSACAATSSSARSRI